MPEYFTPGVYVEELRSTVRPIEAVSTNTLGILGETERGPVPPVPITGTQQFQRVYGGVLSRSKPPGAVSYLSYAVAGFFANGGTRCYVARVIGYGLAYPRLDIRGVSSSVRLMAV